MPRKANASTGIPLGRWREAEARRVVSLWRESGLSASAFTQVNGLANSQRLCWWSKRLKKRDATALAPLTFIPAAVTSAAAATVVRLPGDVVLELADVTAVPPSWVAALATELKRQP